MSSRKRTIYKIRFGNFRSKSKQARVKLCSTLFFGANLRKDALEKKEREGRSEDILYRLLQWFFAAPNLVVLLNKYYIDTSLVRFLDEGYIGGMGV